MPATTAYNYSPWRSFVFFLKILWVCRVSTFSAIAGVLLFYYVVQAQNLLADTSFNYSPFAAGRHWLAFFVGLFLLWAFPIHYAARSILNENSWMVSAALRRRLDPNDLARIQVALRAEHFCLIEYMPRVLGLLPFVAVLLGLWGAYQTVLGVAELPAGKMTIYQIVILMVLDIAVAILFWIFVLKRDQLVARTIQHVNTLYAPTGGISPGISFMSWIIEFSLLGTACIFLLAYFAPIFFTAVAPRAAMVPLLFGSLVLVFGWLVRKTYEHGFPYLLVVVIVCALATGANMSFNEVRQLEPQHSAGYDNRQVDIDAALSRWRDVNGCPEAGQRCPPVLLIAADGGASRAGFVTASIVGELLDEAARRGGTAPPNPARNIFAISAVSGGAFGATIVRAALADAADGNGSPPCKYAHPAWYRFAGFQQHPASFSWRDCLEILTSGDFLSPVFVGLAFRDNLAPPSYLLSESLRIVDRAALLEMAWERHYDYVVNGTYPLLQSGHSCDTANGNKGLCRRFGYLDMSKDGQTWLPLLALNGTSVQTGRRTLTTDLMSTFARPNGAREALYPQAFDFFEMRSTPCSVDRSKGKRVEACAGASLSHDAPDILLSTAALTSARFPLISPSGSIETKAGDGFGDSIVDGGYFENSGLTTALDIARVLHTKGLEPIVLTIANEPENPARDIELPARPAVTPALSKSEVAGFLHGLSARIFGVIASPGETLLHTRDGHASEARDLTVRALEEFREQGGTKDGIVFFSVGMATITPKPDGTPDANGQAEDFCAGFNKQVEMTKVSMSWWLSSAVQADIDAQLCTQRNRKTIRDLMSRLTQAP